MSSRWCVWTFHHLYFLHIDPGKKRKKRNIESIDETSKCKIWSSDMLPPPIWNPSFEFHGLVTDINADLTGLMKIKNVVRNY